jgi:hypothetical protein
MTDKQKPRPTTPEVCNALIEFQTDLLIALRKVRRKKAEPAEILEMVRSVFAHL